MKKIIALVLCAGFLFALAGCKKKTPEEIEQQISSQLGEAKYIDAHISGDISMNIPDAGVQKITIDSDVKADISSGFPKILLSGNIGLAGVMSLPMTFYMDDTKFAVSVLGQNEQSSLSEADKAQIQSVFGNQSVQITLNKTVKESTYNNQRALEIVYDVAPINQLMISANPIGTPSINSYVAYYVLNDKDELDTIAAKMVIISEGEQMDINLNIKFNSMGQPVEISDPTGLTEGTPTTYDILTNNNAA